MSTATIRRIVTGNREVDTAVREIGKALDEIRPRIVATAYSPAAAATAGTATEVPFLLVPSDGGPYELVAVYFTANGAIVANGTDNATIFVRAYPPAGTATLSTGTAIAEVTTKAGQTGSMQYFQTVAVPPVNAAPAGAKLRAARLAGGMSLTVHYAKSGAGVAIPVNSLVTVVLEGVG